MEGGTAQIATKKDAFEKRFLHRKCYQNAFRECSKNTTTWNLITLNQTQELFPSRQLAVTCARLLHMVELLAC